MKLEQICNIDEGRVVSPPTYAVDVPDGKDLFHYAKHLKYMPGVDTKRFMVIYNDKQLCSLRGAPRTVSGHLEIRDCPMLKTVDSDANDVEDLKVSGCPIERVRTNTNIEKLYIDNYTGSLYNIYTPNTTILYLGLRGTTISVYGIPVIKLPREHRINIMIEDRCHTIKGMPYLITKNCRLTTHWTILNNPIDTFNEHPLAEPYDVVCSYRAQYRKSPEKLRVILLNITKDFYQHRWGHLI